MASGKTHQDAQADMWVPLSVPRNPVLLRADVKWDGRGACYLFIMNMFYIWSNCFFDSMRIAVWDINIVYKNIEKKIKINEIGMPINGL